MERRYQSLLEVLQAHATNLQVYKAVKYDEMSSSDDDCHSSKPVFESFKILVGKVRDGCWIGISPISSHLEFSDRPTSEEFLAQRSQQNDTDTQFNTKLKPIPRQPDIYLEALLQRV
jgi:hypothetical protein